MKRIALIGISILLLVLDNTLLPFFSIKSVYPSLLFIFAISYSILNGKKEAVIIGVISGILQDIYFFNGFGVNCLVNMFCCLLAGIIGEGIWKDKKLIPVLTMFITTILKFLGIYLIFHFFNIEIELFKSIYVGLYNSAIMYLTYKLVILFSQKEFKKGTWRIR